jgi:hypothetical protein
LNSYDGKALYFDQIEGSYVELGGVRTYTHYEGGDSDSKTVEVVNPDGTYTSIMARIVENEASNLIRDGQQQIGEIYGWFTVRSGNYLVKDWGGSEVWLEQAIAGLKRVASKATYNPRIGGIDMGLSCIGIYS